MAPRIKDGIGLALRPSEWFISLNIYCKWQMSGRYSSLLEWHVILGTRPRMCHTAYPYLSWQCAGTDSFRAMEPYLGD